MILPCRIHQPPQCVNSLALALLFAAAFLALQPGHARGQDAAGSTFEQAGVGWLPAIPIQITAGGDMGDGDNATPTPRGQSAIVAGDKPVPPYNGPRGATQAYYRCIRSAAQHFMV